MIEHYDITAALATGYHRSAPNELPLCPICGEACSKIYRRYDGEVVGCENCIDVASSTDWWEAIETVLRRGPNGYEFLKGRK